MATLHERRVELEQRHHRLREHLGRIRQHDQHPHALQRGPRPEQLRVPSRLHECRWQHHLERRYADRALDRPVTPQPESSAVNEGQSTSFTATAAANPVAGVQWQLSSNGGSSWSNDTSDTANTASESGKTTSTLTISSASRAQNAYQYRASFTSAAGSATSDAASLTVDWIGPVSTQPESQATVEGKTVSLTAAASSNPSAGVQWQLSSDSGAEWTNDTTDSASTTSSGGTTTSTLTVDPR